MNNESQAAKWAQLLQEFDLLRLLTIYVQSSNSFGVGYDEDYAIQMDLIQAEIASRIAA